MRREENQLDVTEFSDI